MKKKIITMALLGATTSLFALGAEHAYLYKDARIMGMGGASYPSTGSDGQWSYMLEAINNGLLVYKSMETKDVKEYSMWKAFRAMNSPEMKRGLGFMITFMQKLSKSLNEEKS